MSGGGRSSELARWVGVALAAAMIGNVSDGARQEAMRVAAVTARHGMVVTADDRATQAALDVLRRGGNAVDAAACAQFVLNVVEPQNSGIGGGCFLVIYLAREKRVVTIDGRETAPAAATPEMFLRAGQVIPFEERASGGLSVGVPGTLAAVCLAVERYGSGRVKLADLMQPAIRLAEDGIRVSAKLAENLASTRERLGLFPASRSIFFQGDEPLREGDVLRQPDLAATFQAIAEQGPQVLYRGEMARDIVGAVQNNSVSPGRMTLADLAGYQAIERKPVRGTYRGYELFSMGPPSSGGTTLIEILNIAERFPLGEFEPLSAEAIHLFTEAQKLAYADRNAYLADADFVAVPVAALTSKAYAAQRARLIRSDGVLPAPARPGAVLGVAGSGLPAEAYEGCTTHLSVVDSERNLVAMTTTLQSTFGSAMVVPGRGFLLNNQLTDFEASPTDESGRPAANRVEPGKRPRSSMTPTIILRDGEPFMVVGSPGGSTIIAVVADVITAVLDHGLDIGSAVALPRAICRNWPLELEEALAQDAKLVGELRQRGHTPDEKRRGPFGRVHAIVIEPGGTLRGAADWRGEGTAAGY